MKIQKLLALAPSLNRGETLRPDESKGSDTQEGIHMIDITKFKWCHQSLMGELVLKRKRRERM